MFYAVFDIVFAVGACLACPCADLAQSTKAKLLSIDLTGVEEITENHLFAFLEKSLTFASSW